MEKQEIDAKAEVVKQGTYYLIEVVYYVNGTSTMFIDGKKIIKDETFREVVLVLKRQFQTNKDAEDFIKSNAMKRLIKVVNKGGLHY